MFLSLAYSPLTCIYSLFTFSLESSIKPPLCHANFKLVHIVFCSLVYLDIVLRDFDRFLLYIAYCPSRQNCFSPHYCGSSIRSVYFIHPFPAYISCQPYNMCCSVCAPYILHVFSMLFQSSPCCCVLACFSFAILGGLRCARRILRCNAQYVWGVIFLTM